MSSGYAALSVDSGDGTGETPGNISSHGSKDRMQTCCIMFHFLIGFGLILCLGWSTTVISCQGLGHVPPCGASQPWQHFWCNGMADPNDPDRQCVNMCGAIVGDELTKGMHSMQVQNTSEQPSSSVAALRQRSGALRKLRGDEAGQAAVTASRREGVSSLSAPCLNLFLNDTASLEVLENCSADCNDALPEQPVSPFCWSEKVTKTCLKAKTGVFFNRFPSVTGQLLGVCYVFLSLSLVLCCKDRKRAQDIDWGWADSLVWPFPWKFLREQGPEQDLSRLQLQQAALSMLAERASDVASLWTYLKKAQPYYALLLFTVLMLSGDIMQTHGLSELLESIDRGWVPTRGLAEAKAQEGFTDGAWGFLVPCMSLFSSQLDYVDTFTLLFAAATSLYGVFDGVGSSKDISSAMVGNALMPFRSQRQIVQPMVQLLRVAESLSLLPTVAVAASRDMRSAYVIVLAVLLPGSLLLTTFGLPTFRALNPKLGETLPAALAALVLSAFCWPMGLLWPGGFYDPVASCGSRHYLSQLFAAAQPPLYFYTARVLQALLCVIVVVAPSSWFEWLPTWMLASPHIHVSSQQVSQHWTRTLTLTLGLVGAIILSIMVMRQDDLLSITNSAAGTVEVLSERLVQQLNSLGPDHTEVAITLTNLGNAYGDLGDHAKKKDMLSRALAINERAYGPDHTEVAITLTNLGTAYGALGDHAKEKDMLSRALAINERAYGPDHTEVAITLGNLGIAYGALGDHAKKKDMLSRALAIEERAYGPDHTEVAITLGNLGIAYGALGDHAKKKDMLTRALAIKERAWAS